MEGEGHEQFERFHAKSIEKKWKSAATQFISAEENQTHEEATLIELEPEYAEKCRQLAEIQHTTVASVVHYILEQHFALRSHERVFQASPLQLEKNPLLALDGLTVSRQTSASREVAADDFL